MTKLIKILTLFIFTAFCSCSDEPARKNGQFTSEEKPKDQVSEVFQRNLASALKVSETKNTNNELVGIWECSEQNTNNYGIKTTKISVWEFKSNGKWIYDIWNNYMKKPTHGVSSYSYTNNTLSEYDSNKKKIGRYEILWEDDHKSFTVESDNSLDGSYFVKANSNQLAGFGGDDDDGGGGDKQCGYCEGRGTVRCCDLGAFYKPDCLSKSVKVNCMSSPTPCELRVTCCRCKGTGRY